MTSLATALFVAMASLSLVSAGTRFYTRLNVGQDVTLERGSTNFNYLQYLIVGLHPAYPLKRSLLRFGQLDVAGCDSVVSAKLYLNYRYAHKASFMTDAQVPSVARTIVAHQVLQDWTESQATSTKRFNGVYWHQQWLNLGSDAFASPTSSGFIIRPGIDHRGYYYMDVTSAVRNWKNGQPNFGLLIRATNENTPGRDIRFASNAFSDSSKHAFIQVLCETFGSSGGSTGGGGGGGASGGIGNVGEIAAI